MRYFEKFDATAWDVSPSTADQDRATLGLESGRVVYFPKLVFELSDDEKALLTPDVVSPKRKNVCYSLADDSLSGVSDQYKNNAVLHAFMKRFAEHARDLVLTYMPEYKGSLEQARASYRPVQAKGRDTSYRKDDRLLHVDAFPSTPMAGKRILRVFANINPKGEPRVWRLGEPFSDLAAKYVPNIRRPLPLESKILKLVRATRTERTEYDHYMMHLHNTMKADSDYQQNVDQITCELAAGGSWMVFTDVASHAAMSGQYLLEQSFYLPVDGMADPAKSPLKVLEAMLGRVLV